MSEEMQIDGRSYISSKRASELSGYAQDYIGQLARKSLIEARRIGGLWYILQESLEGYKSKAEEYQRQPPLRPDVSEPGTLVFFDGKEYLSAGRAAELTGYTQDYVGQLARAGAIFSHQVGNRWYVERQSILDHKKEKDALLAAVQSQAVGLSKPSQAPVPEIRLNPLGTERKYGGEPLLNYFSEEGDLLPVTAKPQDHGADPGAEIDASAPGNASLQRELAENHAIPIRKRREIAQRYPLSRQDGQYRAQIGPGSQKKPALPALPMLIGAATIVVVISIGYASALKKNSAYASGNLTALPAATDEAFGRVGDMLEPFLTRELIYTRKSQ